MTSFRFLHAADIHLDSPLHGLSRYEGLPEDDIRGATRAAFDNLVRYAIDEAVDFLLIAGDLFDGDWKDMGTGLHLARAMGRLHQARIPVFILAGNHDAASVITRNIPWPPNVTMIGSRKPETHRLAALGIAIHAQSFPTSAVTDNLVLAYPAALDHHFNIGMLHTALAGRPGHAAYAPCTLDDLRAKHYDYWALGHVHEHEIVSAAPHIVFPGNLQGRTIRETGPKGAVIVSVEDGQVAEVRHVALDVIRWAAVDVDCSGIAPSEAADRMRAAMTAAQLLNPANLPLVLRLTLVGDTEAAGAFVDRAGALRDDARAVATAISPDLFVEKIKVAVSVPAASMAPAVISDDFAALLDRAAGSETLRDLLQQDLESFLATAMAVLGDPQDADLRRAAADGEWASILDSTTLALRARLSGTD